MVAVGVVVREDLHVEPVPSGPRFARWGRHAPGLGRAVMPLALVGLCSLAPVTGTDLTTGAARGLLAGLAALTLLAVASGSRGSVRLGLGLTATVAADALLPWQLAWWPVPGVVGVLVYLLAHRLTGPGSAEPSAPLRWGRLAAVDLWVVAGIVGSSAAVLMVFSRLAPPRLGVGASFLTELTPWSLVCAGAGFAVVNAFVEEVLFRGAVLHHLGRVMGSATAVVVQALAFGMLHLNGYPYGPMGVALAFLYGVLLGTVRLRSGGLLAPWIAHVATDIVIFLLIVQAAT